MSKNRDNINKIRMTYSKYFPFKQFQYILSKISKFGAYSKVHYVAL